MNEKAKKKFIEIQSLFTRMSHQQMCVLVESYFIWRTLVFALSIAEAGKDKAEKNVKIFNLYKDFFLPTQQSHLYTFVIVLLKFFDKDPRALSLVALIKQINENKDSFTIEVLQSVHPHLKERQAELTKYSPIDQSSIDLLEQLREKHKVLLSNLKDIRDKQFAHTDIEILNRSFVPNEVEELIEGVQQIFNKLSNSFDLSSTMWDHLKNDAISDTEFLFENLERGEIQRLKKIEEKWGTHK